MKTLYFIWAWLALELSGAALWCGGLLFRLADLALQRGDKLYWKPRRYPRRYLRFGTRLGDAAMLFMNWSLALTARSTKALEASRE